MNITDRRTDRVCLGNFGVAEGVKFILDMHSVHLDDGFPEEWMVL